MSDEDYAIEGADAGASATIPMEAGQIKKGGWVFYIEAGGGGWTYDVFFSILVPMTSLGLYIILYYNIICKYAKLSPRHLLELEKCWYRPHFYRRM